MLCEAGDHAGVRKIMRLRGGGTFATAECELKGMDVLVSSGYP